MRRVVHMDILARYMASRPRTNPDELERLAKSSDKRVVELVVANPSTPPGALEYIAREGDLALRVAVALNASTPTAVLSYLAADKERDVRLAVASNSATPGTTLKSLFDNRHPDNRLRGKRGPQGRQIERGTVLPHSSTKHSASRIEMALATNPATPLAVRAEMFEQPELQPLICATGYVEDSSVRVSEAEKLPRGQRRRVLEVLAHDVESGVRRFVASQSDTPKQLLTKLSVDSEPSVANVARAAAERDPAELGRLASSDDWLVLSIVHDNPETPTETKLSLAKRLSSVADKSTLTKLAYDDTTPSDALIALAGSPHPSVRRAISGRDDLPPEAQVRLATDDSVATRKAIASNETTQPLLLARLAQDHSPLVRREVAWNVSTPPRVLADLAGDCDREVKITVAGNPVTPPATLSLLMKTPPSLKPRGGKRAQTSWYHHDKSARKRLSDDAQDAIALNPNAPAEALRDIMRSRVELHGRLLVNPACPSDVIETIAEGLLRQETPWFGGVASWVPAEYGTHTEQMIDLIIENPSTPDQVLDFFEKAAWVRPISTMRLDPDDRSGLEEDGQATDAKRDAQRSKIREERARRKLTKELTSLGVKKRAKLASFRSNPVALQLDLAHDDSVLVRKSLASATNEHEVLLLLAVDSFAEVRREVARKRESALDVELSRLMWEDEDAGVRLAAAHSSGDFRWERSTLAHDDSAEVREVVARGMVDQETALQLASDSSVAVRMALAKNSYIKDFGKALSALAQDDSASVREVMANRRIDQETALQLASDSSVAVRMALAKNSYIKDYGKALSELAHDTSPEVRSTVISNPGFWDLPQDVVDRLAFDPVLSVQQAMAESYRSCSNSTLSKSALSELVALGGIKFRRYVAGNSRTPPSVLAALAADSNRRVIIALAENPRTGADIREQLAASIDSDVLAALSENIPWHRIRHGNVDRVEPFVALLATNPKTPSWALSDFAKYEHLGSDYRLLELALNNPAFPKSALLRLAQDSSTDPGLLRKIARNQNKKVHQALASNPGTPAAVLTELAESPSPAIRERLATNPNMPPNALVRLIEGQIPLD